MYLLDTDICSYLMDQRDANVRKRLSAIPTHLIFTSAVTEGEVWFGHAHKHRGLKRHLASRAFFAAVQVLPWTSDAARIYGPLRAHLMSIGLDIGANDAMIAAHAIALDAILVTNNTRHFMRIGPPLRLENWVS